MTGYVRTAGRGLNVPIAAGRRPIGAAATTVRLVAAGSSAGRSRWAVVTAPLVGVVALAIVGLQALRASLTRNHTLAVAGSTLLAAAHAQPMRGRVPVTVHRRFNRSRIDAGLALAGSGGQARDQVDLGRILGSVAATADAALGPTMGTVWLRSDA